MAQAAGNRDRRIVIERLTSERNGFGELVEGWTKLAEVWAEFIPAGGGETFKADRREATQTASFKILYLAGVDTRARVRFDGNVYELQAVDQTGRREGLHLITKAREVRTAET